MESERAWARAAIMRAACNREDAPTAERGWLDWLTDCGVRRSPASTRARWSATSARRARCAAGSSRHDPARGGRRAGGGRAADGRAGPRRGGDPGRGDPPWRRPGPADRGDRHRDQGLDRPQPRRPRALTRCTRAPPRPTSCWRRRPTRCSWPTAPATRRRSTTSSTPCASWSARSRCGDLPRPPAAVPGRRPGDLQAALRPPRREPPGQGPADREDRDHLPEPRLRGRRARRRAADRRPTSRCAGRPTSAPPSCRT